MSSSGPPVGSSIYLECSSSAVRGNASSFTINLTDPINLSNGTWVVGCISLSWWYVIFNIDLSNNRFDISTTWDGVQSRINLSILPGVYSATSLIRAIQLAIEAVDPTASTEITLEPNTSQVTFDLIIDPTSGGKYMFDPSAGGTSLLYKVLGAANNTNYSTLGRTVFPQAADLTSGITSLQLRSSIVSSSFASGRPSNILLSFSVTAPPGAVQVVQPFQPIYLPVAAPTIRTIDLQITDQDGRQVRIEQGNDTSVNATVATLVLKRIA